jgi:toxin ParE1/3/4
MPVIRKRPRALDDLSEIWSYIADDSVAQADAFIDSIDEQLRMLATQPLMGRAREELAPNLRSLPISRYVIFYEALPDGIVIVRVLHSARDVDAQFEGE